MLHLESEIANNIFYGSRETDERLPEAAEVYFQKKAEIGVEQAIYQVAKLAVNQTDKFGLVSSRRSSVLQRSLKLTRESSTDCDLFGQRCQFNWGDLQRSTGDTVLWPCRFRR
jgi:hypothetical protein